MLHNKKDTLIREKRRLGLKEEITDQELKDLETNKPIQKIIGFINFEDLNIFVNRKVLIPRYETFEVVQEALKHINKNSKVLDLGCGSGYIGLTIKHKTNANVTLSDIDEEAILQTQENAVHNKLDVTIVKSDLFENINEKFDVIISNPPYVPTKNNLPSSILEYEPSSALYAGEDGNDFYRRIIDQVEMYIKDDGILVLEISPDNVQFLRQEGFEIIKDINDKERIAVKQYKKTVAS